MHTKRPGTEPPLDARLLECAEALKHVTLSTSVAYLQELIDEGHTHLQGLRMAGSRSEKDEARIRSLDLRLKNAQAILDHKLAAA